MIDGQFLLKWNIGNRMRSIEWWHCRWPWVTPDPCVIAMTLNVLEGRFPIASLRIVSTSFCCSAEVSTQWHALVPKCPLTSAEMSWCQSVLVPKCLGSEVSGYRKNLSEVCWWIRTAVRSFGSIFGIWRNTPLSCSFAVFRFSWTPDNVRWQGLVGLHRIVSALWTVGTG